MVQPRSNDRFSNEIIPHPPGPERPELGSGEHAAKRPATRSTTGILSCLRIGQKGGTDNRHIRRDPGRVQ